MHVFYLPLFCPIYNEATQCPFCSALSTEHKSRKWSSSEKAVLTLCASCSHHGKVTVWWQKKEVSTGFTLWTYSFYQLARFLIPLQKDFVMAYASTVLLSSVLNTTVNNIMNTNISFLFLRANRLIFMMHILSINQFILWKGNFNVQYFCWFYVFYCRCAWVFLKALLYSSVQKTASISNLREIKRNHVLV